VVKVPHHGSDDAHYDGMWSELASPSPVAIMTPLRRGSNDLHRDTDVGRLLELCGRLFQTAVPSLVRAKKDSDVERLLRRLRAPRIEMLRGWGHVRARRPSADIAAEWNIELGGDAVELN
jgi:hypothetical protein